VVLVIIYLYDSTSTDFTYNGVPLSQAHDVNVEFEINGSYYVTFKHPLDTEEIYKTIQKDMIVTVNTPDGLQPFRIIESVNTTKKVEFEAWALLYADMRNKLVKPITIRGLSGQAAVNTFVNNLLIDTPFTFTSNITDAHDYHTQDTEERKNNPNQLYNALDVFKDIVTRWQGELVINGYDVRVVNRLGKNTGALLYEKKNISDFTDEESIQDIATRLYGKAEWTERPEGSNQEIKHEISVKVESPLINAYSGIVFEKQYTNNDIRTEKEMTDWLNLKFTTDNIDKPSRNIKVGTNIVDNTVINIGDSLVLKYVKHDVDMEIRMVGYTYDGYANRYITIQLGDAKQSYVGNVQNTVREIETNVNTAVKQTVNQILNANGERMIYSVTEPVGNFKNGDVWFDQQGGMYFWDEASGMWIDHPYNRNMRVMEDEVNTAIETAETAKALAVSEAEQALADANKYADEQDALITQQVSSDVNTAISTANTAKATAESSYTNAVAEATRLDGVQKIAFDNRFGTIQTSVDTFNQSVADVDAKADDALVKAGANANLLTTHQNTLDTINTVTLPNISSTAGTALANAKSAMDEAKLADGKIANYVTTNGLVNGTTVDSKINTATGEISKKITAVEGKIPKEIGGQNYVINSNFASKFSNWHVNNSSYISLNGKVVKASGFAGAGIFATINNTSETETYTISVYIKGTGSIRIGFESGVRIIPIPSKDTFTRINFTTVRGASSTFVLYTNTVDTVLEFKNIQIEKGSILTDWKLAPEDNYTKEEFKIFESTYNSDVTGIRSSLTDLSNKKLDGTTYTNFYNNDYKITAQGVTDAWTAVNKIVDANGNTTETFAKAVYDKNATRRTEDFDEVTKDLVKEATYTAGINGLSGSISTVSGRVDKLVAGGGGRNYALKSNAYYYTTNYKVSEYDLAKIPKGTKIKVSLWGGLDSGVRTFGVYINNGNGTASGNSQIIELTKLDGVFGQGVAVPLAKWTGEAILNVDASKILIYGLDNNSTSPKRIEYVKVETGETFTDWTVAPEDMLGKADFQVFKTTYEANDQAIKARLLAIDSSEEGSIVYRLNETEKTASGNTTTISDIKTKPGEQITGYQTIKERSELYERVIGTDEAGIKSNMARIVMTDSLFKTEVIKNVPSSIGGRNYVLKSNDYYYTNNYKVAEYDLSTIPKGTKIKISLWGGLSSSVRTFGVYVNNSSGVTSGNSQIIKLAKLDGVFGQGVSVPLAKWTAEATLNVDAKKILIYGLDNNSTSPKRIEYVQIETGDYYTDWTAAPEDKANMSAITQLENSISLKVSNAELLSAINLQAGGVLITSGTNKLNITPETTFIQDATIKSAMIDTIDVKKITGIEADFTTMITKGLTADVITSTMIKADDAMFTKLFTNSLATTKLAAQGAWITNANIVSLDASKITAGTIATARLNATQIVTTGLSANVVKSEHILGSTALIDKIFSDTAYITQLTSKTAFISSIQAIDISASKITSGTLDASKITVSNLDASSITANQANLIKAGLTSSSGGTLALSGDQFLSTASDGSQTYIQNGVTGTRNPQGATIGQIGYAYESSSPWYSMQVSHGSHFQIRMSRGDGQLNKQAFYIISGGTESYLNTDNIYLNPASSGRVRVQGAMTVDGVLRTEGTVLVRSKLEYLNGGFIESQSANSNMLINASNKLVIYTNGSNALEFDANNAVFRRKISENSDARLKTNIVDMPIDSLDAIRNMEIKKFDYLDGRTNYYGIIAQQAQQYLPELINTDSEGYLMVDKSAMTYVNMHAIQQLDNKVDDEVTKLKAKITTLEKELALLKGAA
jgi:phage minor structural protein